MNIAFGLLAGWLVFIVLKKRIRSEMYKDYLDDITRLKIDKDNLTKMNNNLSTENTQLKIVNLKNIKAINAIFKTSVYLPEGKTLIRSNADHFNFEISKN